jgi:putative flippase GtrA
MVGSLGFLVNSLCLTLLFGRLHLPVLVAQVASAEIALCCNFVLHDRWTYKGSKTKGLLKRFVIFQGSTWAGLLITTTVVVVSVDLLGLNYLLGLILGSALAMMWNYLWTKHIIFRLNQPGSVS